MDGVVREIPRIAGISSFGAGGANAHIIVQEYEPPTSAVAVQKPSNVVISLSARTADRLKQKARDLLDFIRASQRARETVDLRAMAYTLQVGREAMEERLGFVVASTQELEDKLDAYIYREQAAGDVYRGRVKRNQEITDHDLQQSAGKWANDRDLPKLLDAWVKGSMVEWNSLYAGTKPNRISLPTYPFARERYWRERADILPGTAKPAADAVLHPLLHHNVSDIRQQCYRSTFSGTEFFVADYQMTDAAAGRKAIPAMVYLEMARAAVENALSWRSKPARARKTMELFNIVWADPVVLTQRKQVSVALFAQHDDQLGYEIYSFSDDGMEEIVHCQGQALLRSESARAKIDIAHLTSQMRQGKRDAVTQYGFLSKSGVRYGPVYQGITSVYVGEKQLLAELAIPSAVADEAMVLDEGFVLHPILMDSALQAAFDLVSPENQPSLPLALESLRILGACTKEMVAWVRYAPGGNVEHANLPLDIDLCDRQGNVCIQMRGVTYERESLREMERSSQAAALSASHERFPVVLSAPQGQTFTSGAYAKPTQISLVD